MKKTETDQEEGCQTRKDQPEVAKGTWECNEPQELEAGTVW